LLHSSAGLILLLAIGCASSPRYRRGTLPEPIKPYGKYVETGWASWYGEPYHGRAASSGEVYNMHDLTAAHQRLPFDTVVRVKNLNNKKTVEVRINDRGPFKRNRIIDLSYAAAKAIGMIGPGSARVRIEVIKWGNPQMEGSEP
jgi:rare lipoprotein A